MTYIFGTIVVIIIFAVVIISLKFIGEVFKDLLSDSDEIITGLIVVVVCICIYLFIHYVL
jgi:hypothetical protein